MDNQSSNPQPLRQLGIFHALSVSTITDGGRVKLHRRT